MQRKANSKEPVTKIRKIDSAGSCPGVGIGLKNCAISFGYRRNTVSLGVQLF